MAEAKHCRVWHVPCQQEATAGNMLRCQAMKNTRQISVSNEKHRDTEIYADGSSVAKRSTELAYCWLPEIQRGFFAPPLDSQLHHLHYDPY